MISISNIVNKYKLQNETILLALSGGVDSIVLFDLLIKNNIIFEVAHINHNKRKESEVEYQHINKLCKTNNINLHYKKLEPIKNDFQNTARIKRYEFFNNVMSENNINYLFTAHHINDSIESTIFKMFRGTTIDGLSGVKEYSEIFDIKVIRPLINISKDTIYKYSSDNKLVYFEDISNKDTTFKRNFIRNNIVPYFEQLNKNYIENYNNLKTELEQTNSYLNNVSLKYIKEDKVKIKDFNNLHYIIKKKVLYNLSPIVIKHSTVDDIIDLLKETNGNKSYNLGSNYKLIIDYDYFYISKETKQITKNSINVDSFGEYTFNNKSIIVSKSPVSKSKNIKVCYNDNIFPLTLRNIIPGDKIKLSFGTKKISRILIDNKINKNDRDSILVIEKDEDILAILDLNIVEERKGDKYIYIAMD